MLRTRICYFSRNTALALRRNPAFPRYVVRELPSSTTPPKVPLILRKDKHPRTRLLQAIYAGVKATDDHKKITSMVEKNLDTFIPRITQPQNSYETVIRFLLSHNCIPAVISVYERMTELGFAVPLRLEARILVSLIVNTPDTQEETLKELGTSLQDVIENRGFTDKDLWNVLTIMSNHGFSSTTLLCTMDNFYNTHEPENPAPDIRLYKRFLHHGTESGNVEAGLRSLAILGHSRLWGPRRKLVNQAYASFIAGVRDSPYPNREVIASALNMMSKQGVQPNIVVVNSLISLEVATNSLHRAFAIYHSVKHDPKLRPDEFTFGSLFNVLNRLYNPKRRRFRHGKLITGDIPSPRKLFREMIEALLRRPIGLAFQPSTSLLNVVLRAFIYKTDYVGALVALQCFTEFRIPVNVMTYKLVLTHLMNRTTYWIRAYRKMGDDKWADRFLSLPYPVLDPAFLANLKLGHPLMARILDVCSRSEFNLGWPLYIHDWQHQYQDLPVEYRVPSVDYILGRDPVSLDHPFDAVPLERLLRKAMLCEADPMRELGYGQGAHSHISKVVADAKVEMTPHELDHRLEELESQRKIMENAEAHEEMFEGFTKRRKRRKARSAKKESERAVVTFDEAVKEAEEGREFEVPDAEVDETQRDADKRLEVTIMTVDKTGDRMRIWTRTWDSGKRTKRRRRNGAVEIDKG